ncbi:Rpn family recombination-promoting nuclease/putative transposase [Trichothermofontia sp.]
MYDNVCKFLAETYTQDFAQWLLGDAIGLTQLSPSELSVEPMRADALILLAADQLLLQIEFQTQPEAPIPYRMAEYRLRGYRRYPKLPMRQIVIYLKPTRSERVHQTVFAISGMRHEFEVIRLWECSPDDLLPFPGLWPLAILCGTPDKTATLRRIAQRIERLPDRGIQGNVAAATAVLAGLVLEKTVIQQILREEIVKESVIYQDILSKGVQQGLQQGLQREISLVLRLLKHRFGDLEPTLEARIRSLPVEQLEALGEALLDFPQLEALTAWLDHHA